MAGHDTITPEGRKFYAEVDKLKAQEVFIGFQAGKKKHKAKDGEDGVDMASVAMFNELGTSTSPSRPFLRQTVDDNKDEINEFVENATKQLAKGGSAESCLKKIGAYGVKLVQEKIKSGTFTPNAPSTIQSKGSSKPLIDTGEMRQSVHYVIKGKGGG
jgi:spore germination protein GerM